MSVIKRDGSIEAFDVEKIVADIIADVKENGDAALYRYCEKFDKAKLTSLLVTKEEIEELGKQGIFLHYNSMKEVFI